MRIAYLDVSAVREVRSAVLHPGQPLHTSVYSNDEAVDTLHVGAFFKVHLFGVATVCREAAEHGMDDQSWRLRGMAVLPERQGSGVGSLLLQSCLAYARERGGSLLWCTAREPAFAFYRSHQFSELGPIFEIPGREDCKFQKMGKALV